MIGDDILYPDFMVFMILTLKTVLPKFTVTLLRGIFERDAVIQALQLESSKIKQAYRRIFPKCIKISSGTNGIFFRKVKILTNSRNTQWSKSLLNLVNH